MADDLPTIWPIKPHTKAKHAILKGYLNAWFPIFSHQSSKIEQYKQSETKRKILFIDAFAGPGKYRGGEPGSPVIALQTAFQHKENFPKPIHLCFIEKDKERFESLIRVLEDEQAKFATREDVVVQPPIHGEAVNVIGEMLSSCENQNVPAGPALLFMDQFGYSDVSMSFIERFMKHPQCEIFELIQYQSLDRFLGVESTDKALTTLFGGEEWRGAENLPAKDRKQFILEKYLEALHNRGGVKYTCNFTMFDKQNRPLYWLIFCSQNLFGLEKMKEAMWNVDATGEFKFSDSIAKNQILLLRDAFNQKWLAETLAADLGGKTLSAFQVKEYVLTKTPCFRFIAAFKSLELNNKTKIVSAPENRKKGQYIPREETNKHRYLKQIVIRFKGDMLF